MLNGLTYETYQMATILADLEGISKHQWHISEVEQAKIVQYLLDASQARAVQDIKERQKGLVMIFDA